MSHYTSVKTHLVSPKHILRALADLGFNEVEFHKNPVPLVGYMGDPREYQAQIVIRRKYLGMASNDIGFCRNTDGKYSAVIGDFDAKRFDEYWLNNLSRRYAYHATKDILIEKGFSLVEEEEQAGEIHLTLRRST